MNNIIRSYYFLFHVGLGIVFGYLATYLGAEGFTGVQTGKIMALGSLCGGLGVSILWGWVADRIQKPTLILKIIAFGTFAGFLPMLVLQGYWSIWTTYLVYSFCSIGAMPILDAVASLRAKEQGADFGKMRLFAPAGWMVGSGLLGFYMDYTGKTWNDKTVIVAIAGAYGLMFLFSLALSKAGTEKQQRPKLSEILELFKNRYFVVFIIMAFVNFIALAAYMVYYGPLVESKGFGPKIIGFSLMVGTASEVIFMFYFDKLKKWLGLDLLIILSIVVSMGRWIIIANTNNQYVLVFIQVLHSEVGLFVLACVSFVTDTVKRKLVTTGQTLFYTATFGWGIYIGARWMGYLKDYYGDPSKLFIVSSFIHIIPLSLALYNYFNMRKKKVKG